MINLTTILVVLSSVFMLSSIIPYIIGVVKGDVKPRVVTWFIWATLSAISCIATIVDGEYPTAILISCLVVGSLTVVILGWKNGDKQIGRFDMACLIGAIVGIILWQIFNSPSIAVIAMLLIDFIGGLPTLRHSWQKPGEEQWVTFMMSFIGSLIALINTSNWKITAVAYPIFLVWNNLTLALVIIFRKRFIIAKQNKKESK